MRFALETDYAVRMIAALADSSAGGVASLGASALGEIACVPRPTALKVLRQLKNCGILNSTKGVAGGYRLSREPSEITLAQVIEAIEGKIEISRCLSCDYVCSRTGKEHEGCRFHKIYKGLNEQLKNELSKINFLSEN